MRLRVTTESDTFAYATSPIRFAGLNQEDLLLFMIPMAMASTAGLAPLGSVGCGAFSLWLYKKLTADQPDGFLVLYVASNVGALLHHPVVKKNAALRRIVHGLIKFTNTLWIESGLLPSPSYCNLYER